MVEKSDVVEECSSCVRLKQEIEIARKDQASTLKMIKEKIMSTDKLIKKYQKKCDDFDKQAKLLNDMTMKKENCERNAEVLQEQLNHSLEVTEPQKKTIKRLIQEKFVAEEKMQEMKQKNVDLEEVINHLRQELQLRDEKASSWKLEQQIQAKQIEKEKKSVEKLTKDLEKAKEEIKNGRALVREKNRELRAAARRCDNLDIQVKRMKDELSHGSYRYSSQTKSKLSAKEVTRARRTQQSGKRCVEKNADLVTHSADEQDIASDERPSLTSILDEMTKLDFPPVLSPLRPSLSDQEILPESKDSSSESSSGDGFSSSSDSSSDGEGGGSIGDLEEILELKLKEKDFTCTDTGPDEGLDLNMENCNYLESDVSGEEETEKNQDNEISTNDEQTIHEESKKNCMPDNKETEINDLEERQFEREISSEGEKAIVFDDRDKDKTSSTILDSNIISSSGLITTSTSETLLEGNLCDTTAKNMDTSSTFDSAANSEKLSLDISAVGVDKPEKIEDIDFKNNNLSLSCLKRNLKDNVLKEDQLENFTPNRNNVTSSERKEMMTACINRDNSTELQDGDDAVHDDVNGRNNGVIHNTFTSMDKDEFLSGGIAKVSAHLDKPVTKDALTVFTALKDDDEILNPASLSAADDDKISLSSKEKLFSETDIKCTKDNEGLLVTSNELQCANDKFIEEELEADSGKENAECIPLAKSKNHGENEVEIKCNSSLNRDDMQAEDLPFIKDSLEESGKTPEKELMTEEYKHGEESVVTNEANEESGLLENFDNVSKANSSSDTASDKVNPSVQHSREKKLESGSNDVTCEGASYYETPSTRRRIAHQPKKKSETPNNSCTVNKNIKFSEEILPDIIDKLKQTSTSTNFGDELSDKSHLYEHDENRKTSLQIPKVVDNGSRFNEGENEIVDRQVGKTKRSTIGLCNVDKKKIIRTEKKSKASESTCEDTQKQLYSISFYEENCENDIQENNKLNSNTNALSCTYDDNLEDDHVKDSLASPVNGDKSRVIEDHSLNCHLNSTEDNTKLLSKYESMEMEKICRKAVDKEVPLHKSSTNNFNKDKELQCCDDTSLDKNDTIMDKNTEEVIDEGETLVFNDDAGTDANTRLLGQVLFDSSKDVINNGETFLVDEAGNDVNTVLLGQVFPDSTKDAKDCISPDRKLEESKGSVTNLHLECFIEAEDSAIMDQVTSVKENVFECNVKKLEAEAGDAGCKTLEKKKDVNSDGGNDFNLINTNKPEEDKDKRSFTAINEKLPNFKSDTFNLKYPDIAVDSLPLLSVIDDSLNLFDEKVPLLSPLPSSPASSCESSPVHVFEFETEHSLSSVTRVSSLLSSAPKPSCSTKKQRVLENYGELERPEGEQGDCDEEDNSLNHEQIKEPSNKQKKKKRETLSVRPRFLTEIKYAEKVLRFLCKEQIKMDDVIARVSSPTNISDGTPLAAALVKFIHNEDLMPNIIQRYNERDRQNDTHTSRLGHLTEWNPVMSVFETRVFQMVIRLSEVEHLQGLSTKITSLLNRSIIHSCSVAEGPVKKCVASKCRLLCILSRQESNLQRMRVLCYDIIRLLYTRPGTVLYLMISMAAVWPTVLSSLATACTTPGGLVCLSGENYQPLPCTIQTILTTWVRSNDWVLLGNVIEWLCAWKHVPCRVFSIEQLVEELVRLMKNPSFAHLMPGKDGFPVLGFGLYEVIKALELVTCVLGWAWLNNTLIREIIWDILASWASRTQPVIGNTAAALPHQHVTDGQSDAGNGVQTLIDSLQTSGDNKGDMNSSGTGLPVMTEDTSNEKCETTEATVVAAITLLGLVCRIAIQQHQTSIPQVMPLLVGILERAQDCSVPYVVQFACAYSLLELSPWEPDQVYSVLEKWKLQQDESTLPKSLIQGLSSLNLSLQTGRNYSLLSKRSVDTEEEDEEHEDSESDPLEM